MTIQYSHTVRVSCKDLGVIYYQAAVTQLKDTVTEIPATHPSQSDYRPPAAAGSTGPPPLLSARPSTPASTAAGNISPLTGCHDVINLNLRWRVVRDKHLRGNCDDVDATSCKLCDYYSDYENDNRKERTLLTPGECVRSKSLPSILGGWFSSRRVSFSEPILNKPTKSCHVVSPTTNHWSLQCVSSDSTTACKKSRTDDVSQRPTRALLTGTPALIVAPEHLPSSKLKNIRKEISNGRLSEMSNLSPLENDDNIGDVNNRRTPAYDVVNCRYTSPAIIDSSYREIINVTGSDTFEDSTASTPNVNSRIHLQHTDSYPNSTTHLRTFKTVPSSQSHTKPHKDNWILSKFVVPPTTRPGPINHRVVSLDSSGPLDCRAGDFRRALSNVVSHSCSLAAPRVPAAPARRMSSAKLRTVKLTLVVIASYIICYGPFFVSQMWAAWDENAPFQGNDNFNDNCDDNYKDNYNDNCNDNYKDNYNDSCDDNYKDNYRDNSKHC